MKKFFAILFTCLLLILQTDAAFSQTRQIKFGITYFYPPFIYIGDGGKNFYGFDTEIALALCKLIDATCTFTPMTLENLFTSLDQGNVDAIMGALSITAERKIKYDFAGPYYKSTMSYLGRADSNITTMPQGISNKKIGVVKGSTFEMFLSKNYSDLIKIKTYPNMDDTINDLANKKVDLVLLDTPTADYWVHNSGNQFKIIGAPQHDNISSDQGYGIAVKLGNTQLADQLNAALLTIMNNGTYTAIREKYF